LLFALLQVLLDPLSAFDTLTNLVVVRPQVSFGAVVGKPLNRVPVLAAPPVSKHRSVAKLQHRVFLEPGQEI
jgi:hypothetical protein